MQYAARLAIGYAELVKKTGTLPAFVESFVSFVERCQHKDGSFDQCYPFERTPGVVFDILSTLVDIWRSPYVTGPGRSRLEKVIARAVKFVISTDEFHGEIANHFAEYAFECLYHSHHFSDPRTRAKGQLYLERLIGLQDREEGWFLEYDGADAGYQTRCLRYLTKCAALLDSTEIWDAAERSADFLEHALMPDGSVNPMLGCRSTALLYPSGFEALARRDARFEALARRVRFAWKNQRVPMPSTLDFENAIRLADDAKDAAELCPEAASAAELPFDSGGPRLCHYPRAGLVILRDPGRQVFVQHSLGGSTVVYCHDAENGWTLRHEDSGYMLSNGTKRWVTRMPKIGSLKWVDESGLLVEVPFHRALHDELTPQRMILLRLLNFTVLRWKWTAELFRRIVVRRLMTGKQAISLILTREIAIDSEGVTVADRIQDERPVSQRNQGRLQHCRRIVSTHMASSRYFQDQELESLPLGWAEDVPWDTREACEKRIVAPSPPWRHQSQSA